MIKLLRFLTARKSFVLFITLELISIILIIKTHNYAQTKTHSLQTAISGSMDNKLSAIHNYFNLQRYNDSLLQQNAFLLKALANQNSEGVKPGIFNQYEVIPAYALSNQYNLNHNSLIINKGQNNGVLPEMGVIGTNGVVGIIQKTSGHYARVISILNKSTKLNVALAHTNYTGFLQWKSNDPNLFSIVDMPENAQIKIGDTIVTSGVSSIFPKGIPIGSIIDFETVPGRKSYKINLKTFMDMTNIGPVYVIKNRYKKEIDSLLTKTP